jgi:chemotaxis receptor (MCP) glutamine deamidase CheD
MQDASTGGRQTTIKKKGAGGSEVKVVRVGGVDIEKRSGPSEMQSIPILSEAISKESGRSVRQVDDVALGVQQLESRREGPTDAAQR